MLEMLSYESARNYKGNLNYYCYSHAILAFEVQTVFKRLYAEMIVSISRALLPQTQKANIQYILDNSLFFTVNM